MAPPSRRRRRRWPIAAPSSDDPELVAAHHQPRQHPLRARTNLPRRRPSTSVPSGSTPPISRRSSTSVTSTTITASYVDAEACYREALGLNAGYADAHFYLAVTLEKMGRSDGRTHALARVSEPGAAGGVDRTSSGVLRLKAKGNRPGAKPRQTAGPQRLSFCLLPSAFCLLLPAIVVPGGLVFALAGDALGLVVGAVARTTNRH